MNLIKELAYEIAVYFQNDALHWNIDAQTIPVYIKINTGEDKFDNDLLSEIKNEFRKIDWSDKIIIIATDKESALAIISFELALRKEEMGLGYRLKLKDGDIIGQGWYPLDEDSY